MRDPLVSDDFVLIHLSAHPAALFTNFTEPAGDGAMRPVGGLVFGLYKNWASEDPLKWHVLGLVLHLINTFLLYWLCRRLCMQDIAAVLACALFALHPSHPEAVAWTASTFDLLAALFAILTLIALTFESKFAVYVAAPVFTAVAILSKESAYTIPVVALLLLRRRPRFIYPSLLVAAALFVHRWQVFGGPGGYLDAVTGRPQIFSVTAFSAIKVLLYRPWWPMLTAVNWSAPPDLPLRILLGLFYTVLAGIAWRWRPSRSTHLLLIAAVIAALLPPIHLALIGPDLLSTRVFYLPSVFFCLWFSRMPRHWFFVGVSLLFSFAVLRHNLSVRSEAVRVAERACLVTAASTQNSGDAIVENFPNSLDGVFVSGPGFQECVRQISGNAEARVLRPDTVILAQVLRWNSGSRELQVSSAPR